LVYKLISLVCQGAISISFLANLSPHFWPARLKALYNNHISPVPEDATMPPNTIPLSRLNPILGALLWLIALVLSYLDVAPLSNLSQLLLLAILLITPLALFVVYGSTMPSSPRARHLPQFYWPAALTAFASFLLSPGLPAALLVLPWFLYSGAIAFHGLQRLFQAQVRRVPLRIEEAVISFGFLYLVIGGFWLLLSRGSLTLAQFHEPIVTLTAIHFHYISLGALVIG